MFCESPLMSPKARGVRVRSLRGLTGLSRPKFEERYRISRNSLQNWEDGRNGGLTKQGVFRLITAIKSAKILCTFEWLMYGIGKSPQVVAGSDINLPDKDKSLNQFPEHHDEIERINAELVLFQQHYLSTMSLVVADDGMEPRFTLGEHVAGRENSQEAIKKLVGLDCIVQTGDGSLLLRTIKRVESHNRYMLSCSNPNTSVATPVLYNVELLRAAPVIWTRHKDII